MRKGKIDPKEPNLRLEPEKRLCPAFDPVTVAKFPVAEAEEMGFRVLDNFCKEYIQCIQQPGRSRLPFSIVTDGSTCYTVHKIFQGGP